MAKKRVYELAKDLGLSNKEMVDWLRAHEYDVKSHSSSLEDDQALAVVEKFRGEKGPKVEAPKPSGSGVVLRRKKADTAAEHEHAAALAAQQSAEAPPRSVEVRKAESPPIPVPERKLEPHPAPTEVHPPAAIPAPPTPPPVLPPVAAEKPAVVAAARAERPPAAPKAELQAEPKSAAAQQPASAAPRPVEASRPPAPSSNGPGGGREFIDVTKDNKGGPGQRGKKGPRVEKTESLSKQDLVDLARQRAYVPVRGHKKKSAKKGKQTEITEMSEHKKVIRIDETITVAELSQTMGVKSADLIRKLMANGKMVTQNQPIDFDTASVLALDSGWKVEKVGFELDEFIRETEDKPADLVARPPVVTIMGHVDHGKTSLLDAIRKTNVAAGEAGGITQHIGAYSVDVIGSDGGEASITFLDTPGHEAFTAMRARGANVTDIAVLVVAADDGVMPQTVESINHAKAAEVTVVVAINKIDKPEAQPERIKQQLSEHGLISEEWGGDTMMIPVSARTGEGIEKLLEAILLQAEVMELKANPNKPATGTVIEAKLEKGRGPVATVLVQDGTLRVGDAIVTGVHHGRVRAMMNEHGEWVDDVPPGFPVEVLGLDGAPSAGDDLNVVEDEQAAAVVAEHRLKKQREKDLSKSNKLSIDDILAKGKKDEAKVLKIIVKADVHGSVEALKTALAKLSTPKVSVDVIHSAVGNVTESDVMLGAASKAMIVGFNVKPESKAAETAASQGVTLKQYDIIYEALDDVKLAMEGLLEAIIKEKVVGHAKVLQTFNVPKLGTIAGSSVTDGKITRTSMVRLLRDQKPIITGKIASLKRFKDDVREVDKGFECGIGIENFTDFQPGDVIEAYELETIRPSLTDRKSV